MWQAHRSTLWTCSGLYWSVAFLHQRPKRTRTSTAEAWGFEGRGLPPLGRPSSAPPEPAKAPLADSRGQRVARRSLRQELPPSRKNHQREPALWRGERPWLVDLP